MSIPELVAFGRRWQNTLQNDTIRARSLQAEGIALTALTNKLRTESLQNFAGGQGRDVGGPGTDEPAGCACMASSRFRA